MERVKVIVGVFLLLAFFYQPVFAERIITLAPALTEMVFALGKGGDIVGNTNFCNYPEAAKTIPRVGGHMDINLELIIAKKPDVIFLYTEAYNKLKIMENRTRLVAVKHTSLGDVYDGIEAVAKALEVEKEGKRLIAGIKKRLEGIRKRAGGKKRPKVLLIIGRNPDKLTNMYIIGARDFLNQLIAAAGGENAYTGDINYPSVSIESVAEMKPGVIIELSAFNEGIEDERVIATWQKFPFIPAVKNGKIKIIRDSSWIIPGPRVADIAEKMYSYFFD
jgi:iron complex transport system substrate-binding protein